MAVAGNQVSQPKEMKPQNHATSACHVHLDGSSVIDSIYSVFVAVPSASRSRRRCCHRIPSDLVLPAMMQRRCMMSALNVFEF